jgi:hypothetical protein
VFEYVQIAEEAQQVGPVQFCPPHWPYKAEQMPVPPLLLLLELLLDVAEREQPLPVPEKFCTAPGQMLLATPGENVQFARVAVTVWLVDARPVKEYWPLAFVLVVATPVPWMLTLAPAMGLPVEVVSVPVTVLDPVTACSVELRSSVGDIGVPAEHPAVTLATAAKLPMNESGLRFKCSPSCHQQRWCSESQALQAADQDRDDDAREVGHRESRCKRMFGSKLVGGRWQRGLKKGPATPHLWRGRPPSWTGVRHAHGELRPRRK